MAEFLVRIEVRRPAVLPEDEWVNVMTEEARVAGGYLARGVISRIWRLPGTTSNVGVWSASDATELHTLLSGLPAFRFMTVEVEALGMHYLEQGAPA